MKSDKALFELNEDKNEIEKAINKKNVFATILLM